jgi:hypothetical protein
MKWVLVESSVFRAAAYEEGRRELYLRFRSGEVYRYFDVPEQKYQEFLVADSKGGYFRANILGQFAYERMHKAWRAAS